MITYNPAFDIYHSIYRMAHILERMGADEWFEIDKVRIWDFYLLFPDKVYGITIRRGEQDLFQLRKDRVPLQRNPYDFKGDSRKLFEWIKPVQMSALNCLASCGIIDREKYEQGRVSVSDSNMLGEYLTSVGKLTRREQNVLAFMGSLSRAMSLTGEYGLKARTKLIESRYDAE